MNEDVRAFKDAFGNLKHTKEHIKKDSILKILSLSQTSSSKLSFHIVCGEFSIYNKFVEQCQWPEIVNVICHPNRVRN